MPTTTDHLRTVAQEVITDVIETMTPASDTPPDVPTDKPTVDTQLGDPEEILLLREIRDSLATIAQALAPIH